MRHLHIAVSFALFASVGLAQPATTGATSGAPTLKSIREFPVDVLSRLGREMYRHDQLAWVATDLLMHEVSQQQLAGDGSAGWIVDAKETGAALVRFLRTKGETFEAGYDVSFSESGTPRLRVPLNRRLTPSQRARAKAMTTGVDAYVAAALPWCGGQFNTVVLDDPDGSGFLVYLLRPIPAHGIVPIGGHYRITVSADGKSAEQIDQLFVTCLALNPREGIPKGSDLVAAAVGHLVSPTPLETHVFLSLQAKLPMYVTTPDAQIWVVADGSITRMGHDGAGGGEQTDAQSP